MDELSPGAFEHQEHFPSLPSHQNVIIWPQNAIMFCSIFNEASSVRKAYHSANVVTSQVCNQYYSIVSSRSCILHVAKKLLKKIHQIWCSTHNFGDYGKHIYKHIVHLGILMKMIQGFGSLVPFAIFIKVLP